MGVIKIPECGHGGEILANGVAQRLRLEAGVDSAPPWKVDSGATSRFSVDGGRPVPLEGTPRASGIKITAVLSETKLHGGVNQ